MQSNFERSCKSARAGIVVPAFPIATVRAAADAPGGKPMWRGRRVAAAVAASLSIVAAAAAAELFNHTQVGLNPSGAIHIYSDGMGGGSRPVRNPTQAQLESAARKLDFPAILPKGFPAGTRAEEMMVLGTGAMQIVYDLPGAWRRSNHLVIVILANPKVVTNDAKPIHSKYKLEFFTAKEGLSARFTAGRETVILSRSRITAAELTHFKQTMMDQAR